MKNNTLLFFLLLLCFKSISQTNQDPSLSVGLEALTYGKGTIDVEVLGKILAKKQNELKKEGLKRYVFDRMGNYSYTTKLFIQNSMIVLLDERNQDIIEKELLELSTNYAMIIGFTEIYVKNYSNKKNETNTQVSINNQTNTVLDRYFNELKSINVREIDTSKIDKEKIAKQLLIDIVGTALSENKELKQRGFFDFDSRISYEKSKLFQAYKGQINEEIIEGILNEVTTVVSTYLKSYRYIKDILVNEDYSKLNNLKDEYLNQIDLNSLANSNSILLNFGIKSNNKELINVFKSSAFLNNLDKQIKNYNESLKNVKQIIVKTKPDIGNMFKKESNLYKKIDSGLNEDVFEKKIAAYKLTFQSYDDEYQKLKINAERIVNSLREIKKFSPLLANEDITFLLFKGKVDKVKGDLAKLKIKTDDDKELYTTFSEVFKKTRNKDSISEEDFNQLSKSLDIVESKIKEIGKLKNVPQLSSADLNSFKERFIKYEDTIKNDALINRNFIKQVLASVSGSLLSRNFKNTDTVFIKESADFLSKFYIKTRKLSQKKDFSIDDVLYFENVALPELVKLKILVSDTDNDKILNEILQTSNILIPLMKYYMTPDKLKELKINDDVLSFFGFIANINKLDKANTFTFILQLLDQTHTFITDTFENSDNQNNSKFKKIYEQLVNGIEKYTIINNKLEVIEIDVISFLNTFITKYNKESAYGKHSLYFTLGFAQNIFLSDYKIENGALEEDNLSSIGFASEKIGYKLKLHSFKGRDYENLAISEINDISDDISNSPNPFINEWYLVTYGSGILYKLADLTTNENFDFPHVGIATGLRFYNSLDVNLSIGFPFIENEKFGDNAFLGVSLEIPIGEYIEALGGNK